LKQRGFSGAGTANQCDGFSGGDLQPDVVQRQLLRAGWVRKTQC
jgi:hypothetical protein